MELHERREMIVVDFSAHWQLNDSAHRFAHFAEVEKCGRYINEKLGLHFDPKLILLVAWFHDLFSWTRENHHILSADFVLTSQHPVFADLTDHERQLVSDGCREHRASFKGKYSGIFSQLMSCADRGYPGDVPSMLQRAVQYRQDRGEPEVGIREGAVAHLKEKYGTGGYAAYPLMYEQAFAGELEKQRKIIDSL
jgi:hypothetical protein